MRTTSVLRALTAVTATAVLVGTAAGTASAETPAVPTNLQVGQSFSAPKTCGGDLYVSYADWSSLDVYATVANPENGLNARAALWPVADPTQRSERVYQVASDGSFRVSYAGFTDGTAYAFQVRSEATDGSVSNWSATCEFTIDMTRPTDPTVTSTDYPEDTQGSGPGEFTFTANGASDVAAYEYAGLGMPSGRTEPATLGGDATVTLTPTDEGPGYLQVQSVDRAGNVSNVVTYHFFVTLTSPQIEITQARLGEPLTATFTARQQDAQTFTYLLQGADTPVTVPVGENGSTTITADLPANTGSLEVRSTNSTGTDSPTATSYFEVDTLAPQIEPSTEDPTTTTPLQLTFRANLPNTTHFVYTINDGPAQTAPATNGVATITYTPTTSGWLDIRAYSVTENGTQSGESTTSFWVSE